MTKSKRKPITAHRLFPVLVGLWCAALFGLVSFVVPADLLARVVVASGLPNLVAAAAPPLGFTARALVALLMTGLGGVIGLFIGLRLGARHRVPAGAVRPGPVARKPVVATVVAEAEVVREAPRVRARDAHPDAPPRRPLVVSADMIDEAETHILADDAVPAGLRRRALTAEALVGAGAPLAGAPLASDPLDQTLPGGPAPEPFDPFAIYEADAEPVVAESSFTPPAFLAQALEEAGVAEAPVAGDDDALDLSAEAVLEADAEAEPKAIADAETEAAEEVEAIEEPVAAAETVAAAPPASLFALARQALGQAERSPIADADIDGLGLVQLVERLALAIADHRTALDTALVEDAARASAPAMPRLPETAVEAAPVVAEVPPFAPSEPPVREERYSSLIDMTAAARRAEGGRPLTDINTVVPHGAVPQPVVIFPGAARSQGSAAAAIVPPAPMPFERPHLAAVPDRFSAASQTDAAAAPDAETAGQALRDALATLQRMTANR